MTKFIKATKISDSPRGGKLHDRRPEATVFLNIVNIKYIVKTEDNRMAIQLMGDSEILYSAQPESFCGILEE